MVDEMKGEIREALRQQAEAQLSEGLQSVLSLL